MNNSRIYLKSLRLYFSVFLSFSLATNHLAFAHTEPTTPSLPYGQSGAKKIPPDLESLKNTPSTIDQAQVPTSGPAPTAAGSAATDAGGAAATEVTEFDAPMLACLGAVAPPFKFPKTVAAAKKYSALNKEFMAKCNEGTLDTAVSAVPSAVGAAGGSGVESTGATSLLSGTSLSAATNYEGLCEPMEAEVEKLGEEVRPIHQKEKTECEVQAIAIGSANPPPLPGVSACAESITANKASCNKVTIEVETWQKKALAFLKAHWGKILLALGALGVGLYALSSSSDKQKEEFQTNPTAGPTTEKDKEADKDKGKGDIANAGDTTPTNTSTPTVDTQTTNTANSSGNKAYCRSSNQPLECFVTPGCDLKCVADKYGVSNYAGMDKDTTRIDKNGRPVDGASAATGNPGSSSASLGGDSKSSGKGGAALNASGETGSGNGGSDSATRSASGYGDGSDSFGGGGGGGFGGSSDRDPASNDRYKGQGIFGGKNAAGSNDPAATGPLLPITADLFQRISNVAKTQCVRELVLCNQK